jgi:hypothetical protein
MSSILSSSSKTREESVSKIREEVGSKERDGSGSKARESTEGESSVEVVKVREVKSKERGKEEGRDKGKGIRVVSNEIDVEESGGVGGGEREV